MADEQLADEERVRRAVHLILDYITPSPGLEHTDDLPDGLGERVISELIDTSIVTTEIGTEMMDLGVLMRAATYLVESLILTITQRSGQDRLDIIDSLRENADGMFPDD